MLKYLLTLLIVYGALLPVYAQENNVDTTSNTVFGQIINNIASEEQSNQPSLSKSSVLDEPKDNSALNSSNYIRSNSLASKVGQTAWGYIFLFLLLAGFTGLIVLKRRHCHTP